MDKFKFDFCEDVPKYLQIAKHVKQLMDSSLIEDGEKLPSIRELSLLLKVNTVTIVNAYNKLQSEGFALQKTGSGTYAKKRDTNRLLRKEYSDTFKNLDMESMEKHIDFTGETTICDFFPVATFKDVINEVLDRDGAKALVYQESWGFRGLRDAISSNFWGGRLNSESVLIVSGAQQGIDIAAKSIINVNDNVVVEKPTYSGALSVFKSRRANIMDVQIDEDGINLEAFENILKRNRIKCFYTMSYFQNPTGISYSKKKKIQILNLAEKHDFYIIEDDYLSELIFDERIKYDSFKSLDKFDRVIYIKSFSKIFLPGIRLGYMICPENFIEVMQSSKVNTDIATSSLMQRAMEVYITKGYWIDYIRLLNVMYRDRYNCMCSSINEQLNEFTEYKLPGGGLNFYLKIKSNVDMDCVKLFYNARSQGVLITPGVFFYKNSQDGMKFFRLGFSQTDQNKIIKGIEIIRRALESSGKF